MDFSKMLSLCSTLSWRGYKLNLKPILRFILFSARHRKSRSSCEQMNGVAYSDDLSSSNNETKAEHPRGSKGSKIVIISLLLVAAALVLFLLFKFWQRKKREEQYARLLKLFEEDDELELELGLRD